MNTWEQEFEESCPVFNTELQTLRACSVEDNEENHEWLRKRNYLEVLYDQLKMAYERGFGEIEQDLMRAALQRMHVVINTTGEVEVIKIREEEARASISAIFMHVSTHLSSCFDQFVKCVEEVRALLEEEKSKTATGG